MRTRAVLGGVVSLALLAAPSAVAQISATPSDAARDEQVAARGLFEPEKARIKLRLKGVKHGHVQVGQRFKAVGTVGPFVPGQEVLLLVKRDGKTVKRLTKPVERGGEEGNIGRFDIRSPKVIAPGDWRVRANKLPTPQQERGLAASRGVQVDYPDLDPGDSGKKVELLNELLEKKAYHTASGSSYGSATGRAVLAFRKVNNMSRTTNATPGIFKTLAAGKGGFHLKWPEGGKHVEADISRQVMVLANHGKPQHIFHISSGAPATPTVRGKFPAYRFDAGYNSIGMYYSVYFIGGYATHGYHSVPTYPASHGCLRNPIPNSVFIYNWLDMGDVFYVYD